MKDVARNVMPKSQFELVQMALIIDSFVRADPQ
jgi:hypothetical protein